ncbi:hypothetical protein [Herbaspirillum sp. alder98]|uniref:hypothetical protein n=1 Tax=Herbaspirillum sp. alder98 TaxID=2913096 RepID=UPI001CD87AAA|nr:hypothetical protein [Herbaspirillum sp. alder98]MCA1325037.1 hypothetical protein [Herbaspirillum sp. alder98]
MRGYTLKLHVESPGTLYFSPGEDPTRSIGGHAWFEVVSPDNSSTQAGFAPASPKSGSSSAPGKIYNNDGEGYAGLPAFSVSYEVTADQAKTLTQFIEGPGQFGFDINNYHAISNSCVDFVWKALEVIGMNPLKRQGDIFPLDNVDDFMLLLNLKMLSSSIRGIGSPWHSSWMRRATAQSIETNFWDKTPDGTVTVSPLGQHFSDNPDATNFGVATAMAMGDARHFSDMQNPFRMKSFPLSSFPAFNHAGMTLPTCGKDYIPSWDR